jgi:hypothetical protein
MSILPREISGRRYFFGSGVWFVIAGAVVGAVTITAAGDRFGRVFGALLACVLVARGAMRLRRARTISKDAIVRETVFGTHVGHVVEQRSDKPPSS